MQTAIQLYTLRHLEEPLPETLARVGETAFEGVEFAGFGDASPDEVAAALDDAGLESMSAHVGIDALEEDLAKTVEDYRTVDCDHLVVPWLDAEHFESREAVEATAERLNEIADGLADRGVALSYHNHDQEFQSVDGRPALAVLAEETTDVGLEVDAGWVLAGGTDPVEFLHDHSERIELVHLKDVDVAENRPVELGDGDLDVEAVAEAAAAVGADWLCYEHDHPEDALESLDHGSDVLSRLV
ncbi:MAG: sugar phosphate isomerase/epimerase family protein [Haloarculaceae archaeon]